jgi:hypothetical protein
MTPSRSRAERGGSTVTSARSAMPYGWACRRSKCLEAHMANEVLNRGKLEKVLTALDANWQAEMDGNRPTWL